MNANKAIFATTTTLFLAILALATPSPCPAWYVSGFEKVWDEKEWIEETTGIVFVRIPGGQFQMGSPEGEDGRSSDEGPVHLVKIDSFWMGKYEVTNAQFRIWKKDHKSEEYNGQSLNGDFQPAVAVSWNDAAAFVEWLDGQERYKGKVEFFLPSEAQWEYACRGGAGEARFWGESPDQACGFANVHDSTSAGAFAWNHAPHNCNDHFATTAPTDSDKFQPNPFGLYHMLGNVWEWCRDTWDSEAYKKRDQDAANPVVESGDSGERTFRGGSWVSPPSDVRCAARVSDAPVGANGTVGFRVGAKFLDH